MSSTGYFNAKLRERRFSLGFCYSHSASYCFCRCLPHLPTGHLGFAYPVPLAYAVHGVFVRTIRNGVFAVLLWIKQRRIRSSTPFSDYFHRILTLIEVACKFE